MGLSMHEHKQVDMGRKAGARGDTWEHTGTHTKMRACANGGRKAEVCVQSKMTIKKTEISAQREFLKKYRSLL